MSKRLCGYINIFKQKVIDNILAYFVVNKILSYLRVYKKPFYFRRQKKRERSCDDSVVDFSFM